MGDTPPLPPWKAGDFLQEVRPDFSGLRFLIFSAGVGWGWGCGVPQCKADFLRAPFSSKVRAPLAAMRTLRRACERECRALTSGRAAHPARLRAKRAGARGYAGRTPPATPLAFQTAAGAARNADPRPREGYSHLRGRVRAEVTAGPAVLRGPPPGASTHWGGRADLAGAGCVS